VPLSVPCYLVFPLGTLMVSKLTEAPSGRAEVAMTEMEKLKLAAELEQLLADLDEWVADFHSRLAEVAKVINGPSVPDAQGGKDAGRSVQSLDQGRREGRRSVA
jgi:hypothetical protein